MPDTPQDVEVLGAVRPQVQSQLSGHVNTTTEGNSDSAAVLLDAGDSGFDAANLRSAIDQGRVVVVVEPTSAVNDVLSELTGASVSDARAIAISRAADGKYRTGVVGNSTVSETSFLDEHSAPTVAKPMLKGSSSDPLGANIAALVRGISVPAAPSLLRANTGLMGPPGSSSGEHFIQQSYGHTWGPIGNNWKRAVGKTQSFTAVGNNTFYVYWIDGANPAQYMVILKQNLQFNSGGMVHSEDCFRGLGMFHAASEIREVKAAGADVQLIYSSPDTGGSNPAVATVRQEMRLNQKTQGGSAILPFTAEEGVQLAMADWSVDKRSSHGPTSAGWRFVQSNLYDGFNPLVDKCFNGQQVKPYSAIASSSLTMTTYAVWRVTGNRRPILNLGLELVEGFMIISNGGCRSVDSRGAEWMFAGSGVPRYDLDLAKITKAPV